MGVDDLYVIRHVGCLLDGIESSRPVELEDEPTCEGDG